MARRKADSFDDCPCSGKNLDRFIQPSLLILLSRSEVHGYELIQQLQKMPHFRGDKPDAAGVYRALGLLEERGYVTAKWDLVRRGPAKRRYTLTPSGQACLAQWVETLKGFHEATAALLEIARRAQTGTPKAKASRGRKPATCAQGPGCCE